MADAIRGFSLPRYKELPNVGLYLEQTTKYLNTYLTPLGCPEITTSMVSNYVKKGFIERPKNKQYDGDQIAHLMIIALLKNVLPLENIVKLFRIQEKVYTNQVAYDYFCQELENFLFYVYGIKPEIEQVGTTESPEKRILREVIISLSYTIHLFYCFKLIETDDTE